MYTYPLKKLLLMMIFKYNKMLTLFLHSEEVVEAFPLSLLD